MNADQLKRAIHRSRTSQVIDARKTRTRRGSIRGLSAFIRVRQFGGSAAALRIKNSLCHGSTRMNTDQPGRTIESAGRARPPGD
jgi:hypothetical protein